MGANDKSEATWHPLPPPIEVPSEAIKIGKDMAMEIKGWGDETIGARDNEHQS